MKFRQSGKLTFTETKKLLLQGKVNPVKAAQNLFLCGYQLDQSGACDAAEEIYEQTINILENIHEKDAKKLSHYDFAGCAFNHGLNLYGLSRFDHATAAFQEAIFQYEQLISDCVNSNLIERFANSFRWLALSQVKENNLDLAAQSLIKAISLYRSLLVAPISIKKQNIYKKLLVSSVKSHQKIKTQNYKNLSRAIH